jgi:hypothetical protein
VACGPEGPVALSVLSPGFAASSAILSRRRNVVGELVTEILFLLVAQRQQGNRCHSIIATGGVCSAAGRSFAGSL